MAASDSEMVPMAESTSVSVVTSGGFRRFRRAMQTPFNLVLEARP